MRSTGVRLANCGISAVRTAGRPSVAARSFSSELDFLGSAPAKSMKDPSSRALWEKILLEVPKIAGASEIPKVGPKYEGLLKFMDGLEDSLKAGQSAVEKPPVTVAVTGAAGAIGYATLFRIASGQMLGPDQPVILNLIELPGAMNALKGVVMELQDCAFPLLRGINATDNLEQGFADVKYALLVGAKPRGPGMERGDLLKDNGAIFTKQGAAINKTAHRDIKVLVVGNPANTNCLIAATAAKDLSPTQFTAMMRLDQDRAIAQLAAKANAAVKDIDRVIIWGNHSANQYPDIHHARIGGKRALDLVKDDAWMKKDFIPNVQKRGAAIIAARGASSAASAASAAIHCMRDWALGTDQWISMALPSNGEYGVEKGIYFSYPCISRFGTLAPVLNLPVDPYSAEMMEKSRKELFEERDAVAALLK